MSEIRLTYQGIDSFVRDLAARVNDPSGTYTYVKLLRLTLSNLKELNLFVTPAYRTVKGALESTMTFSLPDDTIQPSAAFVYKKCNGRPILFRLGKQSRHLFESVEFASCPDDVDVEACSTVNVYNYYGTSLDSLYLYQPFYGERYGYKSSRFFGYFSFDAVNNRLEVIGRSVGDMILVVCEIADESCKLIPTDVTPMLGYKVLQQHYEASDVRQAAYMERQFKIALNEFKRRRMENYSYEDYLDAITSEYANNVR